MLKYGIMIGGFLLMCVPDDAGLFRTVIQSLFGLSLFAAGVFLLVDENRG